MHDCEGANPNSVVVETDISSFYEHVYHHRLQNFISDLLPDNSNIAVQVDRILNQFATGRSFGLPVGGQAARILAEILLSSIDRNLSDRGIRWRRYVDDFVIISGSQHKAYQDLGVLANALADIGLSLNRSKTTFLSTGHYSNYMSAQLHGAVGDSHRLMEIDLHFDPYSDTPEQTYEDLKETVQQIDIARILNEEKGKAQADAFVVSQVSRSLRLMSANQALEICRTLLSEQTLHTFRASWATIMRGVATVRAEESNAAIFSQLDKLLDAVIDHSPHLLSIHTNVLHFLRAIRFRRTKARRSFVISVYDSTDVITVRRACMDCWRGWKDRERFLELRSRWLSLHAEQQRMLWLAAKEFGDDGAHFRRQVRGSLGGLWALGFESDLTSSFSGIYSKWA